MQYLTAQWLLPITSPPVEDGYIAIEKGRIAAVGKIRDLKSLPEGLNLPLPRPGSLLTPGLVNTHAHLEQSWPTPVRKEPDELFTAWLLKVIERNRSADSPTGKAERISVGIAELLRTGTTCVNDIASGPESLRLLDEKGLRGIVSLECFHPDAETVDVSKIAESYRRFREGYENHPRLQAGLSPHSPYNFSPNAWKSLLEACQPPCIHTHLAECEDEVRYLKGESSCLPDLHRAVLGRTFCPAETADSPTRYLARYGLLTPQMILAHVVHTSAEDRALIAESGARVAHCPRSNLTLHGRTLQTTGQAADWQNFNIPMGLGTDGRLSTDDLDLRSEARCAMRLHGWTAAQALETLTLGGARVMGLADEIGALAVGQWADVVLWQAASDADSNANYSQTTGLPSEASVEKQEHGGVQTSTLAGLPVSSDVLPEEQVLDPVTCVRQVWVAGECRWQEPA